LFSILLRFSAALRATRVAAFEVDAEVRKNFASILVLYSKAGRLAPLLVG